MTAQTTQANPTRNEVKNWMLLELSLAPRQYWESEDELAATQLAEAAAEHFDCFDWLDDPLHFVWDIPIEIESEASTAMLNRLGL
jgi:hypothetical protein